MDAQGSVAQPRQAEVPLLAAPVLRRLHSQLYRRPSPAVQTFHCQLLEVSWIHQQN